MGEANGENCRFSSSFRNPAYPYWYIAPVPKSKFYVWKGVSAASPAGDR